MYKMKYKPLLFLFFLVAVFAGCKKEATTVDLQYQLDTTVPTGDHFFVSYLNERGDTITEHEHYGWRYSFTGNKPANAYIKASVNPIDSYDLTMRIVVNGAVVKETTTNTASGGIKTISLAYTAN